MQPETTTTKPYPTIEDKMQLFEENGIQVVAYFEADNYDKHDYDATQVIDFDHVSVAVAASNIAKEHGIKIHELGVFWKYDDDGELDGESRSVLAFL